MGRKIKEGSRVSRRVMTKSPIRLNCQRKTRGAANRAAKTLTGKSRKLYSYDTPLANWERELINAWPSTIVD